MRRLQVGLLGTFQVTLDGVPIAHFETVKTRALLAYLAVEAKQPQPREFLAEMLWPERPEGAARANLRHTLGNLRSILGEPYPSCETLSAPSYLLVTREAIQLNPAADIETDTTTFTGLATGSNLFTKLPIGRLEEATRVYRGSFLEDLSLGDSAIFQEWVLLKREQFQCQILKVLYQLAKCFAIIGKFDRALEYARRQVAIAPWNEAAHQQVMRFLAFTEQPAAALSYYEICQRNLAEELGVVPGEETKQLFEQIRAGKLEMPAALRILSNLPLDFHLPAFLRDDLVSPEKPVFVGREQPLARLDILLGEMLHGQTRLAFVIGDAGQGKTSLINEFARRAMDTYPELLVASGSSNAYSGVGDPYLPFRDVMAMLTGDVETRWAAGLIGREQARRLWEAQTSTIQALAAGGSSLIDTILPGEALIFRSVCAAPDRVDWLEHLEEWIRLRRAGKADLEQSYIFEQYTNILRSLTDRYPLILLLDDLQWADSSTISLLFHLGRRLTGSRILIICAYRPEEVTSQTKSERHPLPKVLVEFKRLFGDVWVDLNQTEQTEDRRFVDALLDIEANRLSRAFRTALFHRTEGHPLFTIELLHSMQERGDLMKDEDSCWVSSSALDWKLLPARVEAVIEDRIGRLDDELQQILSIAAVEGEIFTPQVVAKVHKMPEKPILNLLSQQLRRQHRLVSEVESIKTERGWISRYKFSHVLFRDYLYQRLSQAERQLLHGEIAFALEELFEGQLDEIVAQLAYHCLEANFYNQAFKYLVQAAERSARLYAHDETIKQYTQAIELIPYVSQDVRTQAELYRGRGLTWETLGDFEHSLADHESALQTVRSSGEDRLEWRSLIDLGKLWASRDYQHSLDYIEQALQLARQVDDSAILATSLNWIGNWYINAENPTRAVEAHQEALAIFEASGDQHDLANTLDLLGIASLLGGDCTASATYYDRAIALFRELDDSPGLVSSLTGRGNIGGAAYYSLTVAPAIKPCEAQQDFEEAIQLAQEIDSPASEAWALWSLGFLYIVQGDFGCAKQVIHNGLRIASEINHLEWAVGNQAALGNLYLETFAHEKACHQLEQALVQAKELRSQHWVHHITGSLTAAYHMLGDLNQAQACLETVLTPQTSMNTVHKRYCWARRAELAISQGDPTLALEIVEELIESVPGICPGQVIPFLWKLKGEALVALGLHNEAVSFLYEAIENAEAIGERFLLWRIHASLGYLYQVMNNQAAAQKEHSAAKELVNKLAVSIPDEGLNICFLQGTHRWLINFTHPG